MGFDKGDRFGEVTLNEPLAVNCTQDGNDYMVTLPKGTKVLAPLRLLEGEWNRQLASSPKS